MSATLRDRLRGLGEVVPSSPAPAPARPSAEGAPSPDAPARAPSRAPSAPLSASEAAADEVGQLKQELHRILLRRLDLRALEDISDQATLTATIRQAVLEILREDGRPMLQSEREAVIESVVYEVTGLGPLEPLMRDHTISDILVNGPRSIYIERRGKLQRSTTTFRDDQHLLKVIDRIVSRVGRRIDESSPMVDARLPDGSRVNAVIPPLAVDGPVLSIRRFGANLTPARLVELNALTDDMLYLLAGAVKARLNILVSGGTGSGKTTLLNAISSFIPGGERVVTIEDAAELQLQQEHVVRLETRPQNTEGRGEVTMRDLVKNALRMRPDRIIIGETRGAEVLDMLQAMNTGHEGSLTTVHANTPRDALSRVETMILLSGTALPERAMREQITSAIDLIVQATRLSDGSRRVTSVTELTGTESGVIQLQEIFRFRRVGLLADGTVDGFFEATGVRPRFADRLQLAGVTLASDLFVEGRRL